MNFSDLDQFITVVQCGSLTRAAEQLGISQPSISKAVGRVEEVAGARLFTRLGNRIQLNQYGKIYYRAVLRSVGVLEDAIDEIKDFGGRVDGNIRIATTVIGFLEPLLAEFYRKYPGYKLCQYLLPQEAMVDSLLSGKIDFAFSSTPIYEAEIHWIPLQTDEIYVLVSAEHPMYGTRQAPLSAFSGNSVVLNTAGMGSNDDVLYACHQAGFQPVILYAGEDEVLTEKLLGRDTISFITASGLEQRTRHQPHREGACEVGCIKLLSSGCFRTYGVAVLENHYQSQACRCFYEQTMDFFSMAGGA